MSEQESSGHSSDLQNSVLIAIERMIVKKKSSSPSTGVEMRVLFYAHGVLHDGGTIQRTSPYSVLRGRKPTPNLAHD